MKAVVLDRDGVINQDRSDYVKSPNEWQAEPGSLEAIARLNRAHFIVAVVSNQSGIGRGLYDENILEAIHTKMQDELAAHGGHIDRIYYCPHHPEAHCTCRKPEPGMLKQMAHDFKLTYEDVYMIGDAWRDIQAARAVGCQPLLVETGHGQATWRNHGHALTGIHKFVNLAAAVDYILHQQKEV